MPQRQAAERIRQMLRMRRQTSFANTERTINKIIRLVVETGSLTGMRRRRDCFGVFMAYHAAGVAIVTLVLCIRLPVRSLCCEHSRTAQILCFSRGHSTTRRRKSLFCSRNAHSPHRTQHIRPDQTVSHIHLLRASYTHTSQLAVDTQIRSWPTSSAARSSTPQTTGAQRPGRSVLRSSRRPRTRLQPRRHETP